MPKNPQKFEKIAKNHWLGLVTRHWLAVKFENMSTHEKQVEPSVTVTTEEVKVTINGISGLVSTGRTLLEAADDIGAGLMHLCFGNGLCSTCRVEVLEGEQSLSPKEIKERICLDYRFCFDPNTRLACQAKVSGPVEVAAPKPFSTFAPRPKKKSQGK